MVLTMFQRIKTRLSVLRIRLGLLFFRQPPFTVLRVHPGDVVLLEILDPSLTQAKLRQIAQVLHQSIVGAQVIMTNKPMRVEVLHNLRVPQANSGEIIATLPRTDPNNEIQPRK